MAATTVTVKVISSLLTSKKGRKIILYLVFGLIILLMLPFLLLGGLLTSIVGYLNFSETGNIEDDVYYQAILEVKENYDIPSELNPYTLKVIDMLHNEEFKTNKDEIKDFVNNYFVVHSEGDEEEDDEYYFKSPDEIMSMVLTSPFNFDDEKIIAIEQLVYQPPTTEDVVFKGKLPMPCNGYVSSPYGDRIDPINGKRFFHTGIDLVPQHRASLIAVADGTVVNVTTKIGGDYGNNVTIKHNIDGKTLYTFYAHCHSILVQVGTEVKQGDVVAIEGGQPNVDNNPGRSTGAHLHFEIRKSQNGNTVNPADYLFNDTD